MKRVFISVPMAGKTYLEILLELRDARKAYMDEHPNANVKFVDNLGNLDTDGYVHPSLVYLGEAIKKMASCDDVFFYGDWENARGCKVEKLVYDSYFAT